jgi:hypothetical protein
MNAKTCIKYYKEVKGLSETNINYVCSLLRCKTWSEVLSITDVNEMWEKFYYTFNFYFNRACPIINKKISNTPNYKWINNKVTEASSKLKFLYNMYKETVTKANKQIHITFKRKYKCIVKTSKDKFVYSNVASSTNISKTLWKIINDERCNEGKKSVNNILLLHKVQKVMCP